MKRTPVIIFAIVCGVLATVAGLSALWSADENQYTPLEKSYYLSAEDTVWIRPGLNLQILNVEIPDSRKPVVTFKITDDKGQPLDRAGVFTPGSVTTSFCIGYIPEEDSQYVNYITRRVTSPISNVTTDQPTAESSGSYQSLGDGMYSYTFAASLPINYDRTATHTIGIYSTRDLQEFGLSRYVANALRDFVPDGRPVTKLRQVVATENCNQCHNPLGLHGGARRDTRLCILCHTPQNTDPDTGNTVDFKVMVHKIHMGENLPSVRAGRPYKIIGVRQTVFDFSEIAFPRDIRNCETCHKNAAQADNYLLKPSRAACGSCHDDVNWKTGENHAAGAEPDDKYCDRCHWPESEFEYDSTIAGAHMVPYKSKQLKRPKFEIIDVMRAGPGQKPMVHFKITDRDGNPIAPSAMGRIALRLAGPTSDYKWYIQESAASAGYADGIATYVFSGSLPEDATGTYSVGLEGYVNATLNAGTTKEFVYRDAGNNVVKEFAVTGSLVPRRQVVDVAKCNKCHDKLQLHGNSRNDPQYCVGCHNPVMTDTARRPASDNPPEGIHFKRLIHRVHSGEELTRDFTVYGFGNTAHNYNKLRFPGDLRDCTTCHVGNSYTLPLPSGLLPSTTMRDFWTPTQPVAAACLGCHDSIEAAAHAYLQTASFGESCAVCHKEGAEFAVSKVHAR